MLLTPEDIETVDLPRAAIRGYNRRSTDDLLRRVASGLRAHLDERRALEDEIRRLKEELEQIELEQGKRVPEMQESAQRECDRILKKARRQADKIRHRADEEMLARVEALRRAERVQGLVRNELRRMLDAMLDAVNAPSDVMRDSLKNPQLARDLQHITMAAADASRAHDARRAIKPRAALEAGIGVEASAVTVVDLPGEPRVDLAANKPPPELRFP